MNRPLKIGIILLAVSFVALSGQVLKAGPVSEKTAQEIAERILSANSFRKGSAGVKLVWTGTDPQDQPAMYVFTGGSGGFVIISGDDNIAPVLAISENGSFDADDMPEHVQWWMQRMEAQVRATKTPAEGVKKQWAKVAATRLDVWSYDETQVVDKVEHLTPEWDQGNKDLVNFGVNIFNKFCPLDKANKLSVAGCVPVAMAEVLTTLSGIYPDQMPARPVTKKITYTVYSNDRVANSPYNLGTTDFDWEGLRTLTNIQAVKDAKDAGNTALLDNLGRLLVDCGAIIEAMYSFDGTGAYSENIPEKLADNFYMSKQARVEWKEKYTDEQWIRLLKTELSKHPIIYSGSTLDGKYGHAFVFDGYGRIGEQDVFHVNFGWRSLYNGYYRFDNLKTGEDGETGEKEIWGKDCEAVIDLFPDKDQETTQDRILKMYPGTVSNGFWGSTDYAGISASNITPGVQFSLKAGIIKYFGRKIGNSYSYNDKIYVCLRKKNGTLTQIGESQNLSLRSQSYRYQNTSSQDSWAGTINCTIPSGTTIELGDCIALYYQDVDNTMAPVRFDDDGEVIGEIPLNPSTTPIAFIRTESEPKKGDVFPFSLINYGQSYAGTVWTITYPDGTSVKKPQSYDSFQFTQAGRYKIEAAIAATVGGAVLERVVTFVDVSE